MTRSSVRVLFLLVPPKLWTMFSIGIWKVYYYNFDSHFRNLETDRLNTPWFELTLTLQLYYNSHINCKRNRNATLKYVYGLRRNEPLFNAIQVAELRSKAQHHVTSNKIKLLQDAAKVYLKKENIKIQWQPFHQSQDSPSPWTIRTVRLFWCSDRAVYPT